MGGCAYTEACGHLLDEYKEVIKKLSPVKSGLLIPERDDNFSNYWEGVACAIKHIDDLICLVYSNADPCTASDETYLLRWAKILNYPYECGAELTSENLCAWRDLWLSGCLGPNEKTYQFLFDVTGLTDRGFSFSITNPTNWRSCSHTECRRITRCSPVFTVYGDAYEYDRYNWRTGSGCCGDFICRLGRVNCAPYLKEIECMIGSCFFPLGTAIRYEGNL